MSHRDESNYKGAAPAHPEEAAAPTYVSINESNVRAREGSTRSRSALILTGLAPVSWK